VDRRGRHEAVDTVVAGVIDEQEVFQGRCYRFWSPPTTAMMSGVVMDGGRRLSRRLNNLPDCLSVISFVCCPNFSERLSARIGQ